MLGLKKSMVLNFACGYIALFLLPTQVKPVSAYSLTLSCSWGCGSIAQDHLEMCSVCPMVSADRSPPLVPFFLSLSYGTPLALAPSCI